MNYVNIELDNNRLFIFLTLNPDYFVKVNLSEIERNDLLVNNINNRLNKLNKDLDIILKTENLKFTFIKK